MSSSRSRRRRQHSPYSDDSSNDSYSSSSSSDDDEFLQVLNRRKDNNYDDRHRKRRNDDGDGDSESDGDNGMEYRREEEFDDGFDENLRGDEEDRRYLDSLPEVQREEIIYQRFERRRDQELLKERLRRAGKLIPRGQPMPAKRKKSTKMAPEKKRTKPAKERKSATKRRRHEEEDDESIEFDEEDEDLHDTDDDDDDYEYEERRTGRRKPTRAQESATGVRSRDMDIHERKARFEEDAIATPREREASYEEMKKIIVSRKQIEKWVNEPFFDKLMQGCYVRFLLAKTEADKLTYRLCKIEEVEDRRKSYNLTNKIRTNKVFKLRFARSCNSNFKLNKVSNSPVTMSEYNHWLKAMRESNMSPPTANEVREKADKIEECAHNYAYNAEDIRMKMDYKRKHLIDMDRTMLHREKTELDMQKHGLKNDLTMGNLTEEERQSKEAQYKEVKDRIRKVKNLLRRDEALAQPTATATINQQARRHNREVLGKVVAAAMAEHETSRNARVDTFDPFSRRATVSNFFAHSLLASPSPRGPNSVLQVAPMSLEDVLPSPMLSPRGSTLANLYERFDVDLDFDKMDNTLAPHRLKLPPGFDYVPNGTTKFGKSLTLEEYRRQRRM